MLSERSLLVRLGYRESCSFGVRGRYGGSFSHDALFRSYLSGRRLRPLGRAHAGFLSGRLTSSNVVGLIVTGATNVFPDLLLSGVVGRDRERYPPCWTQDGTVQSDESRSWRSAAKCGAAREDRYPWSRCCAPFEDVRPRALEDIIPEGISRHSRMAGRCIGGVGGCYWGVNTELPPRRQPFLASERGNESGAPLIVSAEAKDVQSPARDLPQRERRQMVAVSGRRWTRLRLAQSQRVFRRNGDQNRTRRLSRKRQSGPRASSACPPDRQAGRQRLIRRL